MHQHRLRRLLLRLCLIRRLAVGGRETLGIGETTGTSIAPRTTAAITTTGTCRRGIGRGTTSAAVALALFRPLIATATAATRLILLLAARLRHSSALAGGALVAVMVPTIGLVMIILVDMNVGWEEDLGMLMKNLMVGL